MTSLIDSPAVQPPMFEPTSDDAGSGDGRPQPCRLRARAWWGDQLVADTTAAIRVDREGRAPLLWFPVTDVRLDLFRAEPHDGRSRRWSTELPATTTRSLLAAATDSWSSARPTRHPSGPATP